MSLELNLKQAMTKCRDVLAQLVGRHIGWHTGWQLAIRHPGHRSKASKVSDNIYIYIFLGLHEFAKLVSG